MKKTKIILISVASAIVALILAFGIFVACSIFFGKSVKTNALTNNYSDFMIAFENDTIARDIIDDISIDNCSFNISSDSKTYSFDFAFTYLGQSESIVEFQVYGSDEYVKLLEDSSPLLSSRTLSEKLTLTSNQSYSETRTSLIIGDSDELEKAFSYVYVEFLNDGKHCRIMVPVTIN